MDVLTSAILDAVPDIPSQGFYPHFLLQHLGIDISQIASLCLIMYTLYQGNQYLGSRLYHFILFYFTSCIEVDDWDPLYNHSIDWATAHQMTEVGRELKAVTFDSASPFTLLSNEDCKMFDESGLPSQNTLFNFQEWYSTRPLIFKPNFRGTYFWSHGNWFYWSTGQRENRCGEGYDRTIMIRCFGRSTKPIKNLLSSIKGFTLTKEIRTTQVFRNAIKPDDQGGYWLRQSVQPSRPMRTIALEQEQKARVILDINEYLHPATAHWYATRGIPYRRGYLFHGPPGTGKTSLSFALAGVFRLSIYCVSLGEIGLTDTDLATLFGSLPERCIVLLEDVDSAGFQQDDNDTHTFVKRSIAAPPETNSDSKNASFSKRSKGARSRSKRAEALESKLTGKEKIKSRSLITLAGLLNIIDGAASQIGRVLIMTTNCPSTIDPALIRPGRVDLQIGFTLATHSQICDIYKRMYATDSDFVKSGSMQQNETAGNGDTEASQVDMHNVISFDIRPYKPNVAELPRDRLEDMAKEFADKLHEGVFSPAEIQGYILERKADPVRALQEIGEWMSEKLSARDIGYIVRGKEN